MTFAAAAADPAELGAIRLNWRTADPAVLAALKSALLADGTDDELLGSYVRLVEDRSMPVALQDRLIADADQLTPDNPFDVHSIASSHAGFLVHPGEAADILAGLAAG